MFPAIPVRTCETVNSLNLATSMPSSTFASSSSGCMQSSLPKLTKPLALSYNNEVLLEIVVPISDLFVNYILRGIQSSSTSSWSVGKSNGHQDQTRVEFVIAAMKAVTTAEEATSLTSSLSSAVNEPELKMLALTLQKRLHARLVQTEQLYQIDRKGKMTANAIADRIKEIGVAKGKQIKKQVEDDLRRTYARPNPGTDDLLNYYISHVSPLLSSQKKSKKRKVY